MAGVMEKQALVRTAVLGSAVLSQNTNQFNRILTVAKPNCPYIQFAVRLGYSKSHRLRLHDFVLQEVD